MQTPVSDTHSPETEKILRVIANMQAVAASIAEPQTKSAGNPQSRLERVLYGLPCAHCRSYYAANLDACPICQHRERVSATAAANMICAHAL